MLGSTTKRLLLAVAPLVLATPFLTGCTTPTTPELTSLPEGIWIDVFQGRMDYTEHKIEVSVHNDSDKPFTVLALSLGSRAFDPAAQYERAPSTITAGSTTNLRLLLPQPNCDSDPGRLEVSVKFKHGDTLGRAISYPNDRFGQLPELISSDCQIQAMNEVATTTVADSLKYGTLNGEKVAIVEITYTPTGNPGTLIILDVRGTVLLSLRDPRGPVELDTIPLALDIGAATEPVIYDLMVVPARCDPHAVMEDKVGTRFRFHITTKFGTGLIPLAVGDKMRGELYQFVSDWCGYE